MRLTAKKYRDRTPEHAIHMQILNYLQWQYPRAVIHHSANEISLSISRDMAAAGVPKQWIGTVTTLLKRALARLLASLQRKGQRTGFPDLIVMHEGHLWAFEVKNSTGRLTNAQKACGADIDRNGFRWACVRSVEDVKGAIEDWSRDVKHMNCVGSVVGEVVAFDD